jgi:hypothetical protein
MLKDMMAGLDSKELIELALLLIAVGALSGFLAGVFGIGGGAILVPVFYECFRLAGVPLEVRMPLCIGTSLFSRFRAQYARGAVDMDILRRWWLIVIGVVAGSVTARPRRAAVQDRVRVGGVVGRRLTAAGARQLETRRQDPDRTLCGLPVIGLLSTLMGVGGACFEPVDDILRPADPSGGRDLVGARRPDLDPRRARHVYAGWSAARVFLMSRLAAAVCGRLRLTDRAVLVMPTSLLTAPLGGAPAWRDVEAEPGDGLRRVSLHACSRSGQSAVGWGLRDETVVVSRTQDPNHRWHWLEKSHE